MAKRGRLEFEEGRMTSALFSDDKLQEARIEKEILLYDQVGVKVFLSEKTAKKCNPNVVELKVVGDKDAPGLVYNAPRFSDPSNANPVLAKRDGPADERSDEIKNTAPDAENALGSARENGEKNVFLAPDYSSAESQAEVVTVGDEEDDDDVEIVMQTKRGRFLCANEVINGLSEMEKNLKRDISELVSVEVKKVLQEFISRIEQSCGRPS